MIEVQAGEASAPTVDEQRAALAEVLKSKTFDRCPTLSALLEYLCARQFKQDAKPPKEYDVALDVFGRMPSFDPSTDSIVRVEIFRLRKKLKKYYEGEGAGAPLQISMASGSYIPQYVASRSTPELEVAIAPPINVIAAEKSVPSGPEYSIPSLELVPQPVGPTPERSQWHFHLGWSLAIGFFALLVGAAFLVFFRYQHTASSSTPVLAEKSPVVTSVNPTLSAVVTDGIRILCGSARPQVDRLGMSWSADRFFQGGFGSERAVTTLLRTRDTWLYTHLRSGDFSYNIPLAPGSYELRLYFAELPEETPATLEGQENIRIFGVTLNDKPLLTSFDITADAGLMTADEKVFKDVAPSADGLLHLKFVRSVNAPILSAIKITPGIPHHLRPIRIVTQNKPLTDRTGETWAPDDYFLEGRPLSHTDQTLGAEDTRIYQHERYGNFSYAIPVPTDGEYNVSLRYTEAYWSPAGPGVGGLGSRVFDVYCNGNVLQRSFDIFREAGFDHQVLKRFSHIHANPQGKIDLSFVPSRNYAVVDAIEINDQ